MMTYGLRFTPSASLSIYLRFSRAAEEMAALSIGDSLEEASVALVSLMPSFTALRLMRRPIISLSPSGPKSFEVIFDIVAGYLDGCILAKSPAPEYAHDEWAQGRAHLHLLLSMIEFEDENARIYRITEVRLSRQVITGCFSI